MNASKHTVYVVVCQFRDRVVSTHRTIETATRAASRYSCGSMGATIMAVRPHGATVDSLRDLAEQLTDAEVDAHFRALA